MMLIAVLLLTLSVNPAQEPDARAQAERLARTGAHTEALQRFQALAAANPDDTASRLWIGRLHLLMGHPHRAAAVFESLVATDSQNVEALTGLGRSLTETGELKAAADALNRAEALAADRVDVLAAQGRLHAADGRDTLALAYYGRALAAEPGNAAIRAEADALRATRAHRLELGYDFQAFDPSAGTLHAGRIEVNARVSDAVRLFARGQVLRHDADAPLEPALYAELVALGVDPAIGNSSRTESRGGAGIEWTVHPAVRLRGGAQFGDDTLWLPEVDVFADAMFGSGRTRWTFRTHYFEFGETDLWIGGPGIAIDLTPRATLIGEYLRGRTGIAGGGSETTDSATLGLHGRITTSTTAFFEYHRGLDRLDLFTADMLAAAEANTLSFGGALDFTPFVGLAARYDFQDRTSRVQVHRGSAVLTFRF